MVEKVLPYDRAIVRQETGYWCGPASIQVVLNSLGIKLAEADLARETEALEGNVGWDDRDGTDHISQIVKVLNGHTKAGYFFVDMPNDPPNSSQKERLWTDVVNSIDSGFGVVANIVAPPTNYPKAVAPSTISPSYGGGRVYHYFSVMGYADDGGFRRVWIADSGFTPYGYWMSFDQLATLIPPKGYAAVPRKVVAPAPAPPQQSQPDGLTAETLQRLMKNPNVPLERYRALLPTFREAMIQAGCTTVNRAAMWIAQLGHESKGLQYFEELWGPTSDQRNYDNMMGNRPGEGFKFRGRGPIQVTGRNNYTRLSQWAHSKGYTPSPTFFLDQPAQLASDRFGFLGAVWYWTVERPTINQMCDEDKLEGVTKAINGGTNGIDDRRDRYIAAKALGTAILPTKQGGAMSLIEKGVAQLLPFKNKIRQILRPQFVNESTRSPEEPWPFDIWSDVWNETVWDGYNVTPEMADIPDDVKRSMVAWIQTVAAKQTRIEQKLDILLERTKK